ncbi:MAG: DNA polymerase III subunit alpha, partial [Rhizobiaceae bacterium]|nr:DNA polymerase III subunit alpha [Rhizobiaceae bacterium]
MSRGQGVLANKPDPIREAAKAVANGGKPASGPARAFVHLRVHSAYSLLEGALPIPKIVGHAVDAQAPAIAVTDTNNLFGALEFAQKAAGSGVQPIIGCQIDVRFEDTGESEQTGRRRGENNSTPLVLLAATETGYTNLVRLVSRAYLDNPPDAGVFVPVAWLGDHAEGLICLTGGPRGPIGSAIASGHQAQAEERLLLLRQTFGNRLYVELERVQGFDRRVEAATIELAYRHELPLVATNESFFPAVDDYEAHDALMAIAHGSVIAEDNRPRVTPDNHLKSQREMAVLFADLPEAIDNTIEIAKRCSYYPESRDPILPRFSADKASDAQTALQAESNELKRQAREGLEKRLATQGMAAGFSQSDYSERLEFELGVIERMKYPGYFLIVSDFIKWAKAREIPVGPGRGSGAGSLVAYALTITDVDPLRFSLLFERFLNPDRVSMPDFDIDFCQERREEVIRYVQEKYGRDQVAQIITFGTLQARAVLRDVGRVLQMPYSQVDRLTKMVPANPANPVKLKDAIANEPR